MTAPTETAPDANALTILRQRLEKIAEDYQATLVRLLAEIKERRLKELRQTLIKPQDPTHD